MRFIKRQHPVIEDIGRSLGQLGGIELGEGIGAVSINVPGLKTWGTVLGYRALGSMNLKTAGVSGLTAFDF